MLRIVTPNNQVNIVFYYFKFMTSFTSLVLSTKSGRQTGGGWGQGWAKSDSKLQALCPDLDHQAFQAFWGNSRKLIEKGKTNILSRLKLYSYGDHVCTLIKIMFLVSSCYFFFKSYSSLMC